MRFEKASTVIILILLAAGCAHAATVELQKALEGGRDPFINVGEEAIIELELANPFDVDLPVRVVDKNVIGESGIEIQCLDLTLPARERSVVRYNPITPYVAGEYDLPAARLTYTDPGTGSEIEILSNNMTVHVNGSGSSVVTRQEITQIYQCDGVSMQSTQVSSSSSSNQQQQQEDPSQQQGQEERQRMQQDMVQNNQMQQDMSSLKEEMAAEKEALQKSMDELKKAIEEDPQIKEAHEKLTQEGYNMTRSSLDPEGNGSGSFALNYTRDDGMNASMSGAMKDGELESMKVETDEARQEALSALGNDPAYREMREQLLSKGLSESGALTEQLSWNHTRITVPYNNSSTGESANITAEYVNGSIRDLRIEEAKKGGNDFYYLLAALLLIVAVLAVWRLRKAGAGEHALLPAVMKPARDPVLEARRLLDESERLYAEGREKDACERLSQAVRVYQAHVLGVPGELTSGELIKIMEQRGVGHIEETRDALTLCGRVEFARYRSREEEYRRSLEYARSLIG